MILFKKFIKSIIIPALYYIGLFGLVIRLSKARIYVQFHSIGTRPNDINEQEFRRLVRYFKKHFEITPVDADHGLSLTFDDGYKSSFYNAMKVSTYFMVFVPTKWIDAQEFVSAREVSIMHHNNQLGAHGAYHIDCTLDDDEVENSLKHVKYFCYPYGLYDEDVIKRVQKYYKYAFAVKPLGLGYPDYEIPRIGFYNNESFYVHVFFLAVYCLKKQWYWRIVE